MEPTEILAKFQRMTGNFERAAVEAAVSQKEEITPALLRMLDDSVERAVELDAEEDYMGHLYSMFLLAQFRETRAYPLVVRFAGLPGDLLDSLCGDFITADLGRVLASVCGGDLEGIYSLIENENTYEWVRAAALSSLVTLVAAGEKSRDEIVSYFATLFRGKLPRTHSFVWWALVSHSSDLYPAELLHDIEQLYEDGLIDLRHIGLADVRADLAEGQEQAIARLKMNPAFGLVNDTVKEMSWWASFREKLPAPKHSAREKRAPPTPIQPIRTTPKTGRNEPCPCGSGKKFKKCCGG